MSVGSAVPVGTGLGVMVGVAVAVDVLVGVAVDVAVGVAVQVGVAVGVAVPVGVGGSSIAGSLWRFPVAASAPKYKRMESAMTNRAPNGEILDDLRFSRLDGMGAAGWLARCRAQRSPALARSLSGLMTRSCFKREIDVCGASATAASQSKASSLAGSRLNACVK